MGLWCNFPEYHEPDIDFFLREIIYVIFFLNVILIAFGLVKSQIHSHYGCLYGFSSILSKRDFQ